MANDEPNEQVLVLWRQQSGMLADVPEMAAQTIGEIGSYLSALKERTGGAPELTGYIMTAWEKVNGLNNLIMGQTSALMSAGVIIPALKIQRDELALELNRLLELMGHTPDGNALERLTAALYESWSQTMDTADIESDSQDELLAAIKDDIEYVWNLPEGYGEIVLMAIRGKEEMTEESAALFQAFLNSLGES